MVIHIITRLAMGGAQQLVYEVTKRLNCSNRETLIITGLSSKKNSLVATDNKILDEVLKERIPVEVIPCLSDKISILNDIKSYFQIKRILRKYKPEIVHLHSSKAGLLGRIACRVEKINKVIYHVHGLTHSRSNGLKRLFYFYIEKGLYRITSKYIFVCRQDMRDLIKDGVSAKLKLKSNIIYPGANFLDINHKKRYRTKLRQKLGLSDSDFIIGSIGRLDFQKNPEIFIEIAYKYLKVDDKVKFLWIGKGNDSSTLLSKIKEFGLSKYFLLPGYVEDAEPYYFIFDIFCITSRYEGLPVTAIKSLACENPVVAFKVNGLSDLCESFETILGCEPNDVNDFVNQLTKAKEIILKDYKLIHKESLIVREEFNLESMFKKIIKFYNNLDIKKDFEN